MTRYLIVGGGIIGLTLAREIVKRKLGRVEILEKEPAPGLHASGRNSGVLHAGIYYSPDSLKARFCLRGNLALREYCREHGLPLAENRKVIVAADTEQLPVLDELHRRAKANGADVDMLDEKELLEVEPHARTMERALLSRLTAAVSPGAVVNRLKQELEQSDRASFTGDATFRGLKDKRTARTTRGDFSFDFFINAGGAYADRIARAFELGENYRLIPFRGSYRKLRSEKAHLVRGNIYPVPDIRNPFLGVHLSRSVDGAVYAGPTATPALGREHYSGLRGAGLLGEDGEAARILYMDAVLFLRNPKFRANAFAEIRKYLGRAFYRDASRLVRGLEPGDLTASKKAGIRPQLVDWKNKELVMDFLVERGEHSLHILNAISPAFTSSFAFAAHLANEYLV